MELFNIGPLELLFLLGLAVIILGPQRAAEVAGQLGRFLAGLRRNVNMVRSELGQQLQEETSSLRDVRETLREAAESMQRLDQELAPPPTPPSPPPPALPSSAQSSPVTTISSSASSEERPA